MSCCQITLRPQQAASIAQALLLTLSCGCAAGYGYFRPHIRLFDPGWRGPQVRGPEDENTADFGNDPIGVIER